MNTISYFFGYVFQLMFLPLPLKLRESEIWDIFDYISLIIIIYL